MAKFCECGSGGKNLGQSVCDLILASANTMLFKERLNADGAVAKIDFSTGPFNQAFWDDYLLALPKRNRYIVAGGVDDYEFEMQERESLETANAVEYKIRDGHIDVTYHVFGSKGASTRLFQKYKALECLNLGINIIDDNGSLAGVQDGTDMLLIPIDSTQVRYGAQQNSGQVAHVIVQFRIPHTFDFGSVRLWQPDLSTDLDLLDIRPIVDVLSSGLTATDGSAAVGITLNLDSSYFNGQPFVGQSASNFTVTVNGSPVAVSSVAETSDGVYVLTLASAVATADVVVINLASSNFEMTPATITVA
jgi:hypothetical protein